MGLKFLERAFYKSRKFYDDDFDWDNYTHDSYARRLKGDVEAAYDTFVDPQRTQFDLENGAVQLDGQTLHPNVQLLLEAVLQLAPASVHEVGCGGGDHVANIKKVFPDLDVTGGDRSASQLRFALSRHPELNGALGIQDITMPSSHLWPGADLVYSQAVVMHIHTAASHLVALANMVRIARRHVLLIENTQCHNFVEDIRALQQGGHLCWDALNIYAFRGSTGAKAVLLSKDTLNYPALMTDLDLRHDEKPSRRRLKRATEDSQRAIYGFAPPK